MTHREKAEALFREGYNCAQSVFGAFCEELGTEKAAAMRMAAGLGGGVGRLREVCGAVSGMALVLSARFGGYAPEDKEAKAALYAKIQHCAGEFRARCGAIVCRELLEEADSSPVPESRTAEYYRKRPCAELVGTAAEILEDFLRKNDGN